MFNFVDTCRLCTTDTKNGGINCISNEKLNNIIRQLYQIDITATDQLSNVICNACYESVTKFYFHYDIVKTAQKNQHQFLKMQLTMAISKPKTETQDEDSDVEFVPIPMQAPATKKGRNSDVGGSGVGGGGGGGGGGDDPNNTKKVTASKRISTDDKRPNTSITVKNRNNNDNKTVIRPVRSQLAVTAKRVLNFTSKLSIEPNAAPQAAAPIRTVNVTRQNDGTVILRKVQMAQKPMTSITIKRPTANQLMKSAQSNTSLSVSIPTTAPVTAGTTTSAVATVSTVSPASTVPVSKRVKIDNQLIANATEHLKDIEPKRKTLKSATTTSSVTTQAHLLVRQQTAVDANKITTTHRRTIIGGSGDHSQQQDAEKAAATLANLSASEHQYAKRNNCNDIQGQDTEKTISLTPLSATEHHYSKRNNDSYPTATVHRNRWRATTATATVVAADSTRPDEIKSGSMTNAPSSPILLNQMLRKIKPSIRVRSVQSLNNAKNG